MEGGRERWVRRTVQGALQQSEGIDESGDETGRGDQQSELGGERGERHQRGAARPQRSASHAAKAPGTGTMMSQANIMGP